MTGEVYPKSTHLEWERDGRCYICGDPNDHWLGLEPRSHSRATGDGRTRDDVVYASEPTGAVQKWADAAMFRAEASDAKGGPKAYLLAATPDPLGSIAASALMYTGVVVRDKADITDEQRRYYLTEMQKTKLAMPLESVMFHFMLDDVTRSFGNQIVRQRTAAYAQESLRFAVKDGATLNDAVGLPPSIAGVERWDGSALHPDSREQEMLEVWLEAVAMVGEAYDRLVNMGMPAEDARGLLPLNTLTRLNYISNLRGLHDHAGNRLCTQAQFEWRLVWAAMIEAMRGYCSCLPLPGEAPMNRMHYMDGACDNWQFRAIAGLFRPVCYYTGKCEFMAEFDRACTIRDRVQENHAIGRPSSEWHEDYIPAHAVTLGRPGTVRAIRPEEWLADPTAARR